MVNISWSISIQVAGGPTVTAREGPIAPEATDRIGVTIAGDQSMEVSLQPGPASDIHLLLIKSSQYGDEDANKIITFKDKEAAASDDVINLSGPQFYSGGAVERIGPELKSLIFENKTGEEAQIEIFIARDATPSS